VWEPILPTDYSSPGTAVLGRLSDPRVAQYWDKNHLFAEQLGRTIDAGSGQPKPNCCTRKGIQWDEVAVYAQGAHWDEQLPPSVFLNGPVVKSLEFSKVVSGLLSESVYRKPTADKQR
jgi:hypothetical protein